ncbi:MAG: tRNA (guanosine(37)-N1)-methyltransferase TrmD [Candidatus Lambdaproteobacteria bacterium RIFOXYD1_FULL_56_27]|uniref:tRNA (guanine-N(1)-)-methyltransferase n=1 Tax=Candidatus Lambdaproteobacteria bacterium RIFOXYD2_FULL_56_26 TaxID=1817773 RepID=A0A1F6H3U0_9PROT|nr:MAG: tRNA (guanosine(37)-N1)-methyltransferase TrmD [Candidatus Lambdaproteobacteria bacterium RIFOXYC1_FULL_56_13]OGH05025.1 MAG: tRNA (guanosine(37)-N1)-methyltransferase TrmD [Candidatus Lambdaproteobacteria bacterium RIFOXYD2_FULL_56_26]OGH09490.1 MAG: tRNA (guanosine(37)-N1)-methyltransferase TrmD [Candidatus Lambdaproteobacteria bacterium RIFOXYD1_FULL_56_27]
MTEFWIFTLYPELFDSYLGSGLLGRALEDGKLVVARHNFRDFGLGKHKKVDDTPYGGGAGMVLRPEPILEALEAAEAKAGQRSHRILVTPRAKAYTQADAHRLARMDRPVALVCGRFEGFDERVGSFMDEELSLGDFIMMGGEVAAMAVVESVARLLPQVIGNGESLVCESYESGLLEYGHYTKPLVFRGLEVPPVLAGGDHKKIESWRTADSRQTTRLKRPDLLNPGQGKGPESLEPLEKDHE